ncbi:fibrinogen C domain-containing protein 1 [Striga asiatica]|uniref:Fibrinogen C domain-containing protein 1 n=1 Tax=Striga asiatica TaxID=4170 RepID=A0A5A7Q808_STRAF|nr:fibrinogen C domain-containing protein 1 [Striga asiatica]
MSSHSGVTVNILGYTVEKKSEQTSKKATQRKVDWEALEMGESGITGPVPPPPPYKGVVVPSVGGGSVIAGVVRGVIVPAGVAPPAAALFTNHRPPLPMDNSDDPNKLASTQHEPSSTAAVSAQPLLSKPYPLLEPSIASISGHEQEQED